MKAAKGGKEKTLKRRSPLSISAMRPLHPLLAGTESENMTFDRSDRSNNEIIVRDEKGNPLDEEAIQALLEGKDRSLRRKWIPDNRRATGLFVQDISIDLRRLFSIAINPYEPEVSPEVERELRENGWIEGENVFGSCLIAGSIRAKLTEDEKAKPVIEESMEGVETFVTLPAAGYLITTSESAGALEKAHSYLVKQLNAFNYENQLREA